MEELIMYKKRCSSIIYNYLENKDINKLVSQLNTVENSISKEHNGKDKTLWFKFFKGDTLATDISDISNGLTNGSQQTQLFFKEAFEIAVDNNSLEVYYS